MVGMKTNYIFYGGEDKAQLTDFPVTRVPYTIYVVI